MSRPGLADIWPLSPMQRGMLFHALYDTEAGDVYRGQVIFELTGRLDIAALRAAGQTLLRRYPNLRAGFRTLKSGQPVQVIAREVELPWREVDLRGRGQLEQEVLDEDWSHRFDIVTPPLLRLTVIRLDGERRRVVLTIHHILSDGWSTSILARELLELYRSRGDDSRLPAVASYRDYLEWLARQDAETARAAWRAVLRDVEPTLLVPADATRAPRDPAEVRIELPGALVAELQEGARRHGVTVNTVFRAAWAILLGALTGRTDVVFGATTAGRPPVIPAIETMVGLFINTVPVRASWNHGDSVRDLLIRLQDQQTTMLPHEHLNLADVQNLAGFRDLFDTLTVFQNYPDDTLNMHDSAGRPVDGELRLTGMDGRDATHYPLTLTAMPDRFRLSYQPGVLDRVTVEGIAARLVGVLGQVAADPDRLVRDVDVLLPGERDWLLTEAGVGGSGVSATVPELFTAQAAR
ncbi:MAG TPA: condensation domain-containing protein, partial [Pseudonocardiaceae bacterium]|nr:condensation domain-containing protein [Pseudonocardiaceae bacterium]